MIAFQGFFEDSHLLRGDRAAFRFILYIKTQQFRAASQFPADVSPVGAEIGEKFQAQFLRGCCHLPDGVRLEIISLHGIKPGCPDIGQVFRFCGKDTQKMVGNRTKSNGSSDSLSGSTLVRLGEPKAKTSRWGFSMLSLVDPRKS